MTANNLSQGRAKNATPKNFLVVVLIFVLLGAAVLSNAKHFHFFGSTKNYIICKLPGEREVIPLPIGVLSQVHKWYAKLGPIVSIAPQGVTRLDIKAESAVSHLCHFSDGRTEMYRGKVPVGAIEAINFEVVHSPYPETGNVTNLLTMVKMPDMKWKVVGEDTGP